MENLFDIRVVKHVVFEGVGLALLSSRPSLAHELLFDIVGSAGRIGPEDYRVAGRDLWHWFSDRAGSPWDAVSLRAGLWLAEAMAKSDKLAERSDAEREYVGKLRQLMGDALAALEAA